VVAGAQHVGDGPPPEVGRSGPLGVLEQPVATFLVPRSSDLVLAGHEVRHLVDQAVSRLSSLRGNRKST